jgi:thiol-disulfide isomerase/thioredoxin
MKIVAYHFSSPTCGPCKTIKPAIDDLKEEFSQVTWVSVNTQNDPEGLANRFGVQFVPTIVVTVVKDDGSIMSSEKHSGTTVAGYYRMLRNGLRLIQQ